MQQLGDRIGRQGAAQQEALHLGAACGLEMPLGRTGCVCRGWKDEDVPSPSGDGLGLARCHSRRQARQKLNLIVGWPIKPTLARKHLSLHGERDPKIGY